MKNTNQKVWFITGASKGLGLTLAKKLLFEGEKVAATSRNLEELRKAIGHHENFFALSVDLNDEQNVGLAIDKTVAYFGRIDIIVNNAGYGLAGAIEELTDKETKQNFDINVFGSLNVIRKALPYMRAQRSCHIFNIASIGGFIGTFPGFGIYCATKFAVHGFSESLSEEVKPFGIKVTVVSPGYFRTNFLDSSLNTPNYQISDYQTVRDSQAAHENDFNGNQNGDPEKAATAFIKTASLETPPMHLFLGEDAYALANAKIKAIEADMESVREFATATGFDL